MRPWHLLSLLLGGSMALSASSPAQAHTTAASGTDPVARWSTEKANAWYARQPWLVGANYIPSNAINQLEMFQAATFDPAINDHELGLAESIGMNTVRVFLQDQLWLADPHGTQQRLDTFLTLAAKHHIRPMLVLFDSCWETTPHLGPQHPPIPGVHNSGWVQSPGKRRLLDTAVEPELKQYVQGVVGAFANDDRILAWDIWNEPDNKGGDTLIDAPAKVARVDQLLPQAFAWARAAHPTQPLTSGVWEGNWTDPAKQSPTTAIQLAQSDIITFHDYNWPELFEARIQSLQPLGRPILCTEYMARGAGSTFDTILPVAKQHHVAAINWGLVLGKTQTNLPWDSWQRPYVELKPTVWFHDIFYPDGTPYRAREVDLMRELTGRGTPATAERHAVAASSKPLAPIAPTEHSPATTTLVAATAVPSAAVHSAATSLVTSATVPSAAEAPPIAPAEHAPLTTTTVQAANAEHQTSELVGTH